MILTIWRAACILGAVGFVLLSLNPMGWDPGLRAVLYAGEILFFMFLYSVLRTLAVRAAKKVLDKNRAALFRTAFHRDPELAARLAGGEFHAADD